MTAQGRPEFLRPRRIHARPFDEHKVESAESEDTGQDQYALQQEADQQIVRDNNVAACFEDQSNDEEMPQIDAVAHAAEDREPLRGKEAPQEHSPKCPDKRECN